MNLDMMKMSELGRPDASHEEKSKVERLFQFVRAFTNSRHPIRRKLAEQPTPSLQIEVKSLPDSSEWVAHWTPDDAAREWLLRVHICPPVVPCEAPPEQALAWLLPGWETHTEVAQHIEEKLIPDGTGANLIDRFEDDPQRQSTWDEWSVRRDQWAQEQCQQDLVRALFTKLQALRAELQKGSEQVELVLGVGRLRYESALQSYDHPLIIKPLDIEFDSQKNCLTLTETERPTELYTEPLAEFLTDLRPASDWREALQALHPLDAQTAVILKSMGDWLRLQAGLEAVDLTLEPILFLRDRGAWPARAATSVLEDLAQREAHDLPPYLLRLAGVAPPERMRDEVLTSTDFVANEDVEILFALPANLEQLQLARQIEHKDVVLVQGPPGTGKTHTIANLLGHLLAQGKRVLVTSHTSKALRVLRDKVPENIQPLCVSVLDDAARSRRELEYAVQAIAERMQEGTSNHLKNATRFAHERASILQKIQQARISQRLCVRQEYEPIVVGGESIEPSQAAREVRTGAQIHAWIPGPLLPSELGKVCPLSTADLKWLYASQSRISDYDEQQLMEGLPVPDGLPDVAKFTALLQERQQCQTHARQLVNPIWSGCRASAAALKHLITLATAAQEDLQRLSKPGDWLLALVEAGSHEKMPLVWRELQEHAAQVQALYNQSRSSLLNHSPFLPEPLRTAQNLVYLKEITLHLAQGSGLSVFQLPFKVHLSGNWKPLLEQAECNDQKATQTNQFEALAHYLELHLARAHLCRRWARQVEVIGGPALPQQQPEKVADDWLNYITDTLGWFSRRWQPLMDDTAKLGRPWVEVEFYVPPPAVPHPRLTRAMLLTKNYLLPEWNGHLARLRVEEIKREVSSYIDSLQTEFPEAGGQGVVAKISDALVDGDVEAYAAAYAELEHLQSLEGEHDLRYQLLGKLAQGATQWRLEFKRRSAGFDGPLAEDKDPMAAWRWRQLNDELANRSKLDAGAIAREIEQLTTALNQVTSELIEARCWARQLSIAEKFRLHLVGWLDTIRKIGKGTGKNVEFYRNEARLQLKQGQRAVPVWIMPLAEVFRSLSVEESRFDVVIIDEASQAGMSGLLAAYMGKKVVVVGDHEQVSPDAVGEDLPVARSLQNQYLAGFPNTVLYDGKLSLYDMSRWAASGMLSLNEHFRCLPAIIGFSNRLSYHGKIKPLRDPNSSPLRAVVAHRVPGLRDGRQKINREEANEIVALIRAMCQHESYVGRSIGVIALLGDDQGKLIESLVRQHLPVAEIEARKIICGNAAQFQGDERDVMLLSMVDSNEGDGPMRLVGEGANDLNKKRYNVAASRAQNQMWIVHSVDYKTDLKPGDLRRELLEYAYIEAQNPLADDPLNPTESEFERLVLKALLERGYKVKTQYAVGYYRIDMVAECEGRKLAIECDGERWHSGAEKIAEDMARQAVLERLGWRFHRIRGSLFFREPEQALDQLYQRLAQLNINPTIDHLQAPEDNEIHTSLLRIAATMRLEMANKDQPQPDAAPPVDLSEMTS